MKILFLSSWFPYPPINGAKIRIYNLIRELSKQHEIVLLSFVRTLNMEEVQANIPLLEKYCRSVNVVQAQSFRPKIQDAVKGLFSELPRSVIQTYSPEMERLVREAMQAEPFDVLVASEVNMPYLVSRLAADVTEIPTVLDSIEVALAKDAYRNAHSPIMRIRNRFTWIKLKNYTKSILQKVDACTVPSELEKQNLLEIVPGYSGIKVVPHALDVTQYTGSFGNPHPNTLVYTGAFTYYPNLDAAYYFLKDIYPRIKKFIPTVCTQIIGSTGNAQLENWPIDSSVSFTGMIYDVRPKVAQSWLSIVPLRMGAGTRLKIIESLALGTPVVSTSKGAEGLEVTDGKNILIADTPTEFADAVLQVLRKPDFRETLAQEGRKLVAEKYSSEAMGSNINSLLETVVHSSKKTVRASHLASQEMR